jgi:hypothetical protein
MIAEQKKMAMKPLEEIRDRMKKILNDAMERRSDGLMLSVRHCYYRVSIFLEIQKTAAPLSDEGAAGIAECMY